MLPNLSSLSARTLHTDVLVRNTSPEYIALEDRRRRLLLALDRLDNMPGEQPGFEQRRLRKSLREVAEKLNRLGYLVETELLDMKALALRAMLRDFRPSGSVNERREQARQICAEMVKLCGPDGMGACTDDMRQVMCEALGVNRPYRNTRKKYSAFTHEEKGLATQYATRLAEELNKGVPTHYLVTVGDVLYALEARHTLEIETRRGIALPRGVPRIEAPSRWLYLAWASTGDKNAVKEMQQAYNDLAWYYLTWGETFDMLCNEEARRNVWWDEEAGKYKPGVAGWLDGRAVGTKRARPE